MENAINVNSEREDSSIQDFGVKSAQPFGEDYEGPFEGFLDDVKSTGV